MTNEKQKRHAKRVAKRALKNRRRRNQLVTLWNRYGGQSKAEERTDSERVINNFIKDKVKEPKFNDTIDVIANNNSEDRLENKVENISKTNTDIN